jgi:hypothetical protein
MTWSQGGLSTSVCSSLWSKTAIQHRMRLIWVHTQTHTLEFWSPDMGIEHIRLELWKSENADMGHTHFILDP